MKKNLLLVSSAFLLVISLLLFILLFRNNKQFNENRAFRDIEKQLSFGPRIPGSLAHKKTINYISNNINDNWKVEIDSGTYYNHEITNIIAKNNNNTDDLLILGAHYDTRMYADADPLLENRTNPVLGANDGASGVALLLELSRVIPKNIEKNIWLVFFDAEDQGNIPGWDWILGSTYFVNNMQASPKSVIIVDMIGDKDLNIYKEKNSSIDLTNEIWSIANEIGYSNYFIPEYKYSMLDDHTPFINAGFKAINIIDFDYKYWHTIQDDIENVSPNSLNIVGSTLLEWLIKY